MFKKPSLTFLRRMTTSIGVVQHSRFNVPDWRFGYCLDDNGRGLALMVRWTLLFPEDQSTVLELMLTYLAYVAFSERPDGRMRNFMSHDLTFQEESGSDDSFGRAIWGLGECAAQIDDVEASALAEDLLNRTTLHLRNIKPPRAVAYALLGLTSYYRTHQHPKLKKTIQHNANYLVELYIKNRQNNWRWFENILSYSNAVLPLALLEVSDILKSPSIRKIALESLKWLSDQTEETKNGQRIALPIGQDGWYIRGGKRARFAQQPVDVALTILAASKAYSLTGEVLWLDIARRFQAWFYGANSEGINLANAEDGWCSDGLHHGEASANHGAETVIMYLMAELEMIKLEKLVSDQKLV